ncbi:uncharacterized protein A4U43_C08F13040 [Asparagus officinalis]|uniref:uncharacterized protein At4g17910 n=1 Tax=Asparagus officinalis TaxID=4686 RepID=UPI00098E41A3|nr:uncharacterized protein At4g17910 [Asparagus officinalis]ONK59989.1 uncharacterized protein A4U43_C08F13040 [Asparagus officinalis]
MDLKSLKEEFVSNLTGSSMLEIAALSTIVPALVVLRQWSCSAPVSGTIYAKEVEKKRKDNASSTCKDGRSCMVALFMDFLCVVVPILLIFTVLAEWVYSFTAFVILLLIFCISAKRLSSSSSRFMERPGHMLSLRTSILSYRVSVVLLTCVCILAVDFKIFPRRYAKTETYGTGLMDLGVGSFVVANSLVSRQARGAKSMGWKSALQSTCPLLVLGFLRLVSTKGVGYQVHVGEYGVHWNFFFTLAAVAILTSIVNVHPKKCGIFGLFILVGYQTCLLCGLNEYLISNVRALDLISQNKEGVFSIFGYWGMYLVGVNLGYLILFGEESSTKNGPNIRWARTRVWILCILFWSLTIILDNGVERVSRRMCNLAYVTLVLAQNFQVLSIIMLSDFMPAQKPLVLEETFNYNLLGSFLLANLLTGMVNMLVDTLSASSFAAFGILLGYTFLLTAIVGLAWLYSIRFKFW